jgi:hypothetical protein
MSSLVVESGYSAEMVARNDVEDLIIDFNATPDPELNPDISELIRKSEEVRGYKPEDRNSLIRFTDSDVIDDYRKHSKNSGRKTTYEIRIDLDAEREKEERRHNMTQHRYENREDEIDEVQDTVEGGTFNTDDDLLFSMNPFTGSDSDFGDYGDYFEVE